jgi:hypothetical protein
MWVKITKSDFGTWWEKCVGEAYQVRMPSITKTNEQLFMDTHYILVNKIPGKPTAVAISKSSCEIINGGGLTNKGAKHLLDKEDR